MASNLDLGTFWRRVRQTFTHPRQMARAVRDEPAFGTPFAVAVGVAVLAAAALPADALLAGIQADAARGNVELTTDPSVIARWERLRLVMGELVVEPLRILGIAGFTALLFAMIGPGEAGFTRYFALTAYSRLIASTGLLLGVALMYLGWDESPRLSLATLFFFLPEGTLGYRIFLLTDVFILWMLSVLAVGVAEIEGWKNTAAPAALLLGGYLVVNVILALILPFA